MYMHHVDVVVCVSAMALEDLVSPPERVQLLINTSATATFMRVYS